MGKSNKYNEEDALEQTVARAAADYNERCYKLFEQTVVKLAKDTGLDEEECREWLGGLI